MSYLLYTEYKAQDIKELNTRGTGDEVDTVESSTWITRTTEMERSTEQIQDESSTEQIQDESNIMRQMMDEPRMNTETEALTSRSVQLIPETRAEMAGDDIEDEDESWEDFRWETSTQVTIPPSLFDDVGGEWGDDYQEEWEEGWK